jgi:hypothetical protein
MNNMFSMIFSLLPAALSLAEGLRPWNVVFLCSGRGGGGGVKNIVFTFFALLKP